MVHDILRLLIPPIYRIWLKKIEGLDNIPKNGQFIIAANHSSYYDVILPHILILPKINKKIHALVNSEYWNYPVCRQFLNVGECIPVFVEKKNHSKEKNRQSLDKALAYLLKKEPVLIFPEGTRSYDGKIGRGRTGIARLALKAKVPVLPFGIIGANKVMPRGKTLPRLARCSIKIGRPLHFGKYHNKKINKKMLREVTTKIMREIAALIGQKYNH